MSKKELGLDRSQGMKTIWRQCAFVLGACAITAATAGNADADCGWYSQQNGSHNVTNEVDAFSCNRGNSATLGGWIAGVTNCPPGFLSSNSGGCLHNPSGTWITGWILIADAN